MTAQRRTPAWWLGVLMSASCGCGGVTAPETCDVSGEVVYANGTPLTDGEVRFQSTTASDLTVVGKIEAGAFQLRTVAPGGTADGAPPGTYTVSVTPAGDGRSTEAVAVVRPEVTIKAGEPNRIRVQVKKLTPRR